MGTYVTARQFCKLLDEVRAKEILVAHNSIVDNAGFLYTTDVQSMANGVWVVGRPNEVQLRTQEFLDDSIWSIINLDLSAHGR